MKVVWTSAMVIFSVRFFVSRKPTIRMYVTGSTQSVYANGSPYAVPHAVTYIVS
eukprot:CAMPEP_0202847392 /NCGR_PEP_ID=MMETSP1389-20130828/75281_1 /ASSEMBLY_ACC=CAM_ASM_000865 /TAXON_ID=302021 /ORGANISM="Rhodomonas sp., Strain CCMP768" /LENGTH=53 /DNA_ID=CAMNT_0049525093 /DNA_START=45 /DNA_END=203 /DNA_ORIENTATION=+